LNPQSKSPCGLEKARRFETIYDSKTTTKERPWDIIPPLHLATLDGVKNFMNTWIARALLTLILILPYSVALQAQTQSKTTKPASSISGKVTIKNKGAAGISVSLRRTEMNSPFEFLPGTVTDQDGNYRITNVSPGSYDVTPGNAAYVVADNNNIRSRSVTLVEGENVENINFALVRGGVITGKITDADGRPVIQQPVRLVRADPADSRNPQNVGTSFGASNLGTDDRGVYRIFGLNPGRYKVATGRPADGSAGFTMPGRAIYKEVYYPDVTDVAKATVIEVSEGSEAANIDITLSRASETFSATGKVVDEKGIGLPGVRFGLQRMVGERPEFTNAFVMGNGSGNFTAEGLLPGKYTVFLMQEANAEVRPDDTTFDIFDSDINGVTIRLVKGASISGVVVLESENKQALAKLVNLQVAGYVRTNSTYGMGMSARSTIAADGSFRVAGLPAGTANVNLNPTSDMNQMKGFALARIERDGVVQPSGIEVKEGEQVTGIRMIVSYGNAAIQGVVNIQNGPLPPGARIVVWLTKPGETNNRFRPPRVDERGRFAADGIPPGTYDLWVNVMGAQQSSRSPGTKQLVTLQDGITTDVAVTFDLAPPKP
jgi:hypothetical protein